MAARNPLPALAPGTEEQAVPGPRRGAPQFLVMAIRMAALGLSFVAQVVMARVTSLAAFGTVNTALALLNLLVVPAAMGHEVAAIRYVAVMRESRPRLRGLTARFIRTVSLSSLVTSSLVAVAAGVEYALGHRDAAIAAAILAPIVSALALVRAGEGWLRGFGKLVRALINSGVVIPAVTIILILAEKMALGSGEKVGVGGAMAARAAATGLAAVSVALFVWIALGRRLHPLEPVGRSLANEIRRASYVYCGIGLLAMVLTQADIVAVSVFMGPAQAGVYTAAARVAQATGVALVAVNFVLAPRVARLFFAGKKDRLQREVSSAANWSTLLMAAACAVVIPASPLILSLFGANFGGAADALRILMFGQLISAVIGPVGVALQMTGKQGQAMRALGVAALLDLVLFAFLIPPLGLNGAACATAVCTAGQNLGMLYYVRHDIGIWSLPGPLVKLLPR